MEPIDSPEQPAARTPDPHTPPLFDLPAEPIDLPPAPTAGDSRSGRLIARLRQPRRAAVVTLIVGALAATGGVALAAANSSNTVAAAPGLGMRGGHGMVHGEFTVSDGKGGYQTELTQRGTVTSFSGGTLTVKSTDGYTHSYTTDSTTMFGRGHGMGRGGRMHGPFNQMGQPGQNGAPAAGNATGGTATPSTANGAMPNTTLPNNTVPNNTVPNNTVPNATVPNGNMPNNVAPSGTTNTTPNITVGETVTVLAIRNGNTDHAQRVMPMPQMNQNGKGQNGNGQNGNGFGGFFGHRRGGHPMMGNQFPGMSGQGATGNQGGGTAPAMPNGQPGGPMGQMNNGAPANGPTTNAPTVGSQSMPDNSPGSDSSSAGSDSQTG